MNDITPKDPEIMKRLLGIYSKCRGYELINFEKNKDGTYCTTFQYLVKGTDGDFQTCQVEFARCNLLLNDNLTLHVEICSNGGELYSVYFNDKCL